ncbi:MAG: SPFH domain-containing protein [Bacteroidota bacterium]
MEPHIIIGFGLVAMMVIQLVWAASRLKKCPPGKLLVIYGKTNAGGIQVLSEGSAFIWPIIQNFEYFDTVFDPIKKEYEKIFTNQNNRVNVEIRATYSVSLDNYQAVKAVQRFSEVDKDKVATVVEDTIASGLREVVGEITIKEMKASAFTETLEAICNEKLRNLGLELQNLTVINIADESNSINGVTPEKLKSILQLYMNDQQAEDCFADLKRVLK